MLVQSAFDAFANLHAASPLHTEVIGDINPEAPPGSSGFLRIVSWVMWGCIIAGVVALLIAGGMFGYEKWSTGQIESPKKVMATLVGLTIVVSAATIVNTVVVPA